MLVAIINAVCDYVSHIVYREVAVLSILLLHDVPFTSC